MTGEAETVALTRRYSASPARVFQAFSDPHLVARWLRPNPGIGLTVEAFDFRVGGHYRFVYRLPDGQVVRLGGDYLAIEPPHEIRFSWVIEPPDPHAGIQSEVSVAIAPRDPGCTLTIRHSRLGAPGAPERHRAGWEGALGLLESVLAEPAG